MPRRCPKPQVVIAFLAVAAACGGREGKEEAAAKGAGVEAGAGAARAEADAGAKARAEADAAAGARAGAPAGGGREARSEAEREALVRAEGAARKLGGTLKKRLGEALATSTPAGAASVCADEAQRLGEGIAAETGAKVGRSSLRLRNPRNAASPWVEAWLQAASGGPASAAAPLRAIADGEEGPVARVVLPIAVEAVCVNCHGPREGLGTDVTALLDARYPADAAIGYAVGDLRGALWAEVAVGSGAG